MRTFLSEVKRLKLCHGNRINSIQKKKRLLETIKRQLDFAYAHVGIMSFHRIESLENRQAAIQRSW